jgi:hypothetical protein
VVSGSLHGKAGVEAKLGVPRPERQRLLEGRNGFAQLTGLRVKIGEHVPGLGVSRAFAHEILEGARGCAVGAEEEQSLRPGVKERLAQRTAHCFLSMIAEQS